MSLAKVAIVGRPNVGKSSLLNRLAGRRVSIVDPTPGVTRDRVSTLIEIEAPIDTPKGTPSRFIELFDTGGYGVYVAEGGRFDDVGADLSDLTPHIEGQIRTARDDADLVLFVVDAQAGITALDQTIARMLREEGSTTKVQTVANKTDSDDWLADALEIAGLGFGEPHCVSASNGYGMRKLFEVLYENASGTHDEQDDPASAEVKLAIVGKRNSGKSTLINTLAGEERLIVSEIAGTTRDSVDVRLELDGRSILAIDTAGLRKRKSFSGDVEYYAYHRMLSSIRRADVALLLIDATADVSQVDQKLAQELQRQFKPTIIVVNKCDLVDDTKISPEDFLEYLTEQLRGLDYAPIVFISAEKHEGLDELLAMAFNLHEQAGHREATGPLNRLVEEILKKRGPSSRLGTQAKLYFATQVEVYPPTIALKVNRPDLFKGQYERYIMNRLREALPFSEVPIRLIFSPRGRQGVEEMKQAARRRDKAAGVEEIDESDE